MTRVVTRIWDHPDLALRFGFFFLMCVGLVLASIFLWVGKLDGGQWVTVCGILFGVDRVCNGLAEGMARRGGGDAQ